jgi:AcrR family transcriptional regulator
MLGTPSPSTPARILAATAHRIATAGAAELTLQEVAEAAGVSKALIHYHFTDKAELLTRVAGWLAGEVVERESRALDEVAPAHAVDALWRWLDGELARGDVRVLLDLATVPTDGVRDAVREAAQARRAAAARTVQRLFGLLSLTPRVPVTLMADVLVAFVDGMALDATLAPERNHRVAFDVFWLAMLSLAE